MRFMGFLRSYTDLLITGPSDVPIVHVLLPFY